MNSTSHYGHDAFGKIKFKNYYGDKGIFVEVGKNFLIQRMQNYNAPKE